MKLTLKIKGQDVTVEMEEAKRIWEELSSVFSSQQYVPMPYDTHRPPWRDDDTVDTFISVYEKYLRDNPKPKYQYKTVPGFRETTAVPWWLVPVDPGITFDTSKITCAQR